MIDLLGGRAVHARGGARDRYREVHVAAGERIDGDAGLLAERYAALGLDELYVADLDAIRGAQPQDVIVRRLALRAPIWLDAGTSLPDQAQRYVDLGVTRVIVGLETLGSWAALESIVRQVGQDRVVFSLDLKAGAPIADSLAAEAGQDPAAVDRFAARAAAAGAGTIIVLDLARVGIGAGPDFATIERVRRQVPGVNLFVGGGIRRLDDLATLAASACDGALVATAVHEGALDAEAIAAARHFSATR